MSHAPTITVNRQVLLEGPLQLSIKLVHVTPADEEATGLDFLPEGCLRIWKQLTFSVLTPWHYLFSRDSANMAESCNLSAPPLPVYSAPENKALLFFGGGIYDGRLSPLVTLQFFSF